MWSISSRKRVSIIGKWRWWAPGHDTEGDFIVNPDNIITHMCNYSGGTWNLIDFDHVEIIFAYEPGAQSERIIHKFLISQDVSEMTLEGNEKFKAFFDQEINQLITFSPPAQICPRLGHWDWSLNGNTRNLILKPCGTLTCDQLGGIWRFDGEGYLVIAFLRGSIDEESKEDQIRMMLSEDGSEMKAISPSRSYQATHVRDLDDSDKHALTTPHILDPFHREVQENVIPVEITSSDYVKDEQFGGPENLILRRSENWKLWTGSTFYSWVKIDFLGVPISVSGIELTLVHKKELAPESTRIWIYDSSIKDFKFIARLELDFSADSTIRFWIKPVITSAVGIELRSHEIPQNQLAGIRLLPHVLCEPESPDHEIKPIEPASPLPPLDPIIPKPQLAQSFYKSIALALKEHNYVSNYYKVQQVPLHKANIDMEAELNASIKELQEANIDAARALKEAKESNDLMKKELKDATIEARRQQQELEDLNVRISEYETRIREQELSITKLEASLKDTKEKSDHTENELNTKIKELKHAKIIVEGALKESEEANDSVQKLLNEKTIEAQAQNSTINEYVSTIHDLKSGTAELRADLKATKEKSHQTEEELNAKIKALKDQKKIVTERALKEAEEAKYSMQKLLNDKAIELQAWNSTINEQTSTIQELNSGTAELRSDLKSTKEKSHQTEERLNTKIKALKDSKKIVERALKEAEEAKYSMKKLLNDKAIEVQAWNSTINEQISTIQELNSGTAELRADLKATKEKSHQTEEELNAKIKALKDSKKIVVERALKEAEEAKYSMQKLLNDKAIEVQAWNSTINEQVSTIRDLKSGTAELKARNAKQQQSEEELNAKIKELNDEKIASDRALKEAYHAKDSMKELLQNQATQAERQLQEEQELNKRIRTQDSRIEKLKSVNTNLEAELQDTKLKSYQTQKELNADRRALQNANKEANDSMKKIFNDKNIEAVRQLEKASNQIISQKDSTIKARLEAHLEDMIKESKEKDRSYNKLEQESTAMKEKLNSMIETSNQQITTLQQDAQSKAIFSAYRDEEIEKYRAEIEIYKEWKTSLQKEESKHQNVVMPREEPKTGCLYRMLGQTLYVFDCASKQRQQHVMNDLPSYNFGEQFVCLSHATIMIAGGTVNSQCISKCYEIDILQWKSIQKSSMNETREGHGLINYDGEVFCFGGMGRVYTDATWLKSAEKYRMDQNSWRFIPDLPQICDGVSCAILSNNIYITSHKFTVLRFNPQTYAYNYLPIQQDICCWNSIAVVNNQLIHIAYDDWRLCTEDGQIVETHKGGFGPNADSYFVTNQNIIYLMADHAQVYELDYRNGSEPRQLYFN